MGLGLWSLSVIYIFKTDNISKNDKPAATAVIKAQCAEPAVCKHGVLVSVLKADSWEVHIAICQKLHFNAGICCRGKSI